MERRGIVVALALTLPLALYGIPYAYASTQSTYVEASPYTNVATGASHTFILMCASPSDYTIRFAIDEGSGNIPAYPNSNGVILNSAGSHILTNGDVPNGWEVTVQNNYANTLGMGLEIICQTPVTVAGIGVPQFGSLYVAIALGAVAYFVLSRRFTRRPTISAVVEA
jgi:hypothetical protein